MVKGTVTVIPLLLGVLLLLASTSVLAQVEDNPLDPSDKYPRLGGEVGLSSAWQSGEYTAGCGRFLEGSQINGLVAIAYDRPVGTIFRFEALLGWQARGLASTYNSTERVTLATDNGIARADVDFENVGSGSFSYLFLLPSMKLYFTRGLYAGAGLSANLLTGASTQYTKNILSKTVVVDDIGLSEVYYPEEESSDPYSRVFEPESRDDASAFGLDIAIYAGFELRIGKKFTLGPRVLYTIPMMPVLTNPDLKLNTLQFLIGGRLNL